MNIDNTLPQVLESQAQHVSEHRHLVLKRGSVRSTATSLGRPYWSYSNRLHSIVGSGEPITGQQSETMLPTSTTWASCTSRPAPWSQTGRGRSTTLLILVGAAHMRNLYISNIHRGALARINASSLLDVNIARGRKVHAHYSCFILLILVIPRSLHQASILRS